MPWGEPVQPPGFAKWDKPKVLIGKYLRAEEKIGKNNQPNTVHHLEIDGEPLQFWGTMILNDLLSQVEPGTLIRIEYTGARPTDKGTIKEFVVQPWVDEFETARP